MRACGQLGKDSPSLVTGTFPVSDNFSFRSGVAAALQEGMEPRTSAGEPVLLPPVTLSGPSGRRVTVAIDPAAGVATVGDLADALGLARRSTVLVDGRAVERRRPLDRSGLIEGSRVSGFDGARAIGRGAARGCLSAPAVERSQVEPSDSGSAEAGPSDSGPSDSGPDGREPGDAVRAPVTRGLVVSVEAGPDAGGQVILAPGRHVVGRASTAAVDLDDRAVELHHAVVDVAADGRASLTQLAGRVPCRWLGPGAGDPAAGESLEPDGDVHAGTASTSGAGPLGRDAVVVVGASRLRFGPSPSEPDRAAVLTDRPNDPWRRSIHRAPRSLPVWAPDAIAAPTATRSSVAGAGGLLAALLSVVGGVAIAVIMRNPMFLLFSAVGLFVSLGSRLSGRLTRRKEERQRRLTSRQDRERFIAAVATQRSARSAYHRAVSPLAHEAVAVALHGRAALWERRAEHDDAFGVTLGWGAVSWEPSIDGDIEPADLAAIVDAASRFGDAPVRTELGPGASVAVAGDHAEAVARAMLVQLAVFTGPADWRLVVVSDRPDQWGWAAWLPHAAADVVDPVDVFAVDTTLGRLDDGDARHVVVVTDRADLLANRTGALRRFLGTASSVAVLAVVRDDTSVPSMCRSVLEIGSRCQARWCPDTSVATSTSALHAAGLTVVVAEDVARTLAHVHDPEDPSEASGALPQTIGIGTLMKRADDVAIDDPIALAAAWRPGREPSWRSGAGHPTAVIGMTPDGVVEIDLVRDGPHALIAGTTGAGKSELLRTLVASLAARSSPEDLTFVLIDYKGGSTFDACADLPHTVGLVTDLDEHLAARALSSLEAEIRRRERVLRDVAAEDLDAYRAKMHERPEAVTLPRLVVVIDEFAALKTELPGFITALVGVAQRGRSLGIHLVLATQRPAGVVSDDIRANTNLRVALRLNDRADATDIVGDAAPSGFARGTPGRAMMRLGPSETIVFQTATSLAPHRVTSGAPVTVVGGPPAVGPGEVSASGPGEASAAGGRPAPSELTVLTRTIRQAASLCEIAPPFRPWLEALPRVIDAGDIGELLGSHPEGATTSAGAVVGVIDDPSSQRRLPLRWEPRNGNLGLIGSFGSGTTTALRTVLTAGPTGQHVYVLDARGDGRLDELAAMTGCGGVVGRYDSERRARVLRLVGGELARRQSTPPTGAESGDPPIVLAIDGLSGLLDAVSAPGDADEHATLVRILNDGVAVGVYCVATLERGAGVPMSVLAAFGQRWLFHLDDAGDAAVMGLRPTHVPPAIPGRIVLPASKLEAQLVMLSMPTGPASVATVTDVDAGGDGGGAAAGPQTIATLPDDVAALGLPHSTVDAGGATLLTAGLEFTTLRPSALEVPDGEHALVVGPARSGRSTALVTLAAGWRDAHGGGVVVVHSPRPTSPVAAWARAEGDVELVDASTLAERARAVTGHERTLFVVDDAERVEDVDQAMLTLVSTRHPHVVILAAARPDALRTMYGHWTSVVRRSRIGIAMASGADTDAELFGESVPRRMPIAARRGLAWVFDGGGRRLVQVAHHRVATAEPDGAAAGGQAKGGQTSANGSVAPATTSPAGTPNQDSASVP